MSVHITSAADTDHIHIQHAAGKGLDNDKYKQYFGFVNYDIFFIFIFLIDHDFSGPFKLIQIVTDIHFNPNHPPRHPPAAPHHPPPAPHPPSPAPRHPPPAPRHPPQTSRTGEATFLSPSVPRSMSVAPVLCHSTV